MLQIRTERTELGVLSFLPGGTYKIRLSLEIDRGRGLRSSFSCVRSLNCGFIILSETSPYQMHT